MSETSSRLDSSSPSTYLSDPSSDFIPIPPPTYLRSWQPEYPQREPSLPTLFTNLRSRCDDELLTLRGYTTLPTELRDRIQHYINISIFHTLFSEPDPSYLTFQIRDNLWREPGMLLINPPCGEIKVQCEDQPDWIFDTLVLLDDRPRGKRMGDASYFDRFDDYWYKDVNTQMAKEAAEAFWGANRFRVGSRCLWELVEEAGGRAKAFIERLEVIVETEEGGLKEKLVLTSQFPRLREVVFHMDGYEAEILKQVMEVLETLEEHDVVVSVHGLEAWQDSDPGHDSPSIYDLAARGEIQVSDAQLQKWRKGGIRYARWQNTDITERLDCYRTVGKGGRRRGRKRVWLMDRRSEMREGRGNWYERTIPASF